MAPPSLLSRLYRDLAELHDAPYPGVAIFTDDADVRKFCLVLTPPSGPWKNLSLHFDVYLPDTWPASPPSVSSSVGGIRHPNLFGSYICCDLLKEEDHIYRPEGYTGGYTPALTLRGLFLQFLTFFSSSKVEQEHGDYVEIGEHFVVRYAHEEDLGLALSRAGRPHEAARRVPGSPFSTATQDALREEWDADRRPVVIVGRQTTPVGLLVRTAKSPNPSCHRLHRIEEINPRWVETSQVLRHWQCKRCPYGSEALPAVPHPAAGAKGRARDVVKASVSLTPPAICQLGLLNDDVLLELAAHLTSESILSFSEAYPLFRAVVQTNHVLLTRELRCFFLRTGLADSVLGIGVALDPRARTLSSDFDWLSQRAFAEFGVRQSVEKREFGFFLPLAFSLPHFHRVKLVIWARLAEIDAEVQRAENQMSRTPRRRAPGPPRRQETVGVVYRMMNNIVVALMRSCDDALSTVRSGRGQSLLHASEKAVVAYCHLFHLLLCLVREDTAILRDATSRLRRFIDQKDLRIKTHVPDLGELIVLIMLVLFRPPVDGGPPIKWGALAGPFLEEAIVRNVRWVLKDAPHLEVLEAGPSDFRLAETFARSRTSLRLIMFQITFLDLFFTAYAKDVGRLDSNYGFPDKELPERMVEAVKEIYKVNTWPAFFTRVKFTQGAGFGKEKFCDMLRDAVKTSAARGYHRPVSVSQLSRLRGQRSRIEEKSLRST
ncbi:hypothetical protein DFH07DRAFT_771449 [Mycena maculata]|uniref:UBC core domain-containing protein n=1 Tax=Mycena maculata TaxID=230809 RepID=A0AAD7JC98_9AGAR|nr:hypothetical protein DFH07DRAFT_771449 [Mycena maculata]